MFMGFVKYLPGVVWSSRSCHSFESYLFQSFFYISIVLDNNTLFTGLIKCVDLVDVDKSV